MSANSDRIAADITAIATDISAISDGIKTLAANVAAADAATNEAALGKIADQLDATKASLDGIVTAVNAPIPPAA